jgi:molybdopterin molybdotransferase
MPIPFVDARRLILDQIKPLGAEQVLLLAATGRILAEGVAATCDLPHYDVSAMDGFAVHAADVRPGVPLKITGYIPAGGRPTPAVTAGCAVKIMTGAALPAGCDAVVPVEETREADGRVEILAPVARRQHIRFRGEDVAAGAPVLPAGTLIGPPAISLLATLGRIMVPVYRRARVAIVSTGDELVEPGGLPEPGQVVNANAYSLAAAVQGGGAEPVLLGIARDEKESHRRLFAAGLECDALITSAGVSAGDRDLVREVLDELGVESRFWKIAMKPGGPTAFGLRGRVPVFSLPGNPVSTMVTFETLVRPALLSMMGHRRVLRPLYRGILQEEVRKPAGKTLFLRVAVTERDGAYLVRPCGDQRTGILSTMLRAGGLALLPDTASSLPAGSTVDLLLLGDEVLMREAEDVQPRRKACP